MRRELWRDTVAAQGSDIECAALHEIKDGAVAPRNRFLDFAQVHGGETPHVGATHDEAAHVNGTEGVGKIARHWCTRRAEQDNLTKESGRIDAVHDDVGMAGGIHGDTCAFTISEFMYGRNLLIGRDIDDGVNAALLGQFAAGSHWIKRDDTRAHELIELGSKITNEAEAEDGDGIVEVELRNAGADHGNFGEADEDGIFRGDANWNRVEAAPLVGVAVLEALHRTMLAGIEDTVTRLEIGDSGADGENTPDGGVAGADGEGGVRFEAMETCELSASTDQGNIVGHQYFPRLQGRIWNVLVDKNDLPFGWELNGRNRHDQPSQSLIILPEPFCEVGLPL